MSLVCWHIVVFHDVNSCSSVLLEHLTFFSMANWKDVILLLEIEGKQTVMYIQHMSLSSQMSSIYMKLKFLIVMFAVILCL